jgi:multidrug efflux pump subunit AcrA (membrane-fusion protein)
MPILSGQPCAVLDALAQFQFDVMKRLNRKFASLQRIAQLLEQVGDLTVLVPNIGDLIPISSITLDTYARLVQNCPFLGLPETPTAESLAQLRQRVIEAYSALVRKLLNHPFLRMNKLQEALAKFQSDINAGAAVVSDYIKCLQTICDTIGAIGTAFANISQADIGKEIANYTTNFVAKSGQVLTEGQKVKVEQVHTTITEIKALSTDVVTDAQTVVP